MRMSWMRKLAASLTSALALAAGSQAADPAPSAAPPAASETPAPGAEVPPQASGVALDQLLVLPSSRTYSVERKGGLTRGEWRARYAEVRAEVQKEKDALAVAEAKLDTAAGGQWKVNPIPGADTSESSDSPLDFQLRGELRRHREELERLERRLRQLDIEANLAGVPENWRG